jgi:type VI secretion system secreted protein Hcp
MDFDSFVLMLFLFLMFRMAFVLLISLMPNLAFHQPAYIQINKVRGFWEDIFGSGNEGSPEIVITSEEKGSFDMFLKIEGIDGESRDDKHRDWIEIESFYMSTSQIWIGGLDQLVIDISIDKLIDKSSPKIMEKCAAFDIIPSMDLEFCHASGDKSLFCMYELSDVLVSSYQTSGDTSSDIRPSETITLSFGSIKVSYYELDDAGHRKGTVVFSWDSETGVIS